MPGIVEEIKRLKAEREAVILAHNYVDGSIQDVADFVGDSLELSIKAKEAKAKVIVCSGVRFMAETAKLLSPDAVVLLPNPDAGCPMADMADAAAVAAYRAANPDTVMVAYVNTTAATKASVDICCTSGNAEKIVKLIPKDKKVMFLPDRNLGANLNHKCGRTMELWAGECPIHDKVTVKMIEEARKAHPGVKVLLHPECRPEAVKAADAALSTAGILKYIRESDDPEFIIGTESGILHRLKKENPEKKFYPLQPEMICDDMKKLTLENVRDSLRDLKPRIELSEDLLKNAVAPIEKMLSASK